ncbi:hypothetical protein JCM19301_3762 [Jejuia pallidilutea]|uniref:Uncharacterized protein n=1 Tax=Jejuia pallidilutea TaxID=504487 RepID=A0A090WCN7_9FLAO|nr:hypothetical protein JCM19301_3762 [Jejuia pallidilutea]
MFNNNHILISSVDRFIVTTGSSTTPYMVLEKKLAQVVKVGEFQSTKDQLYKFLNTDPAS